MVNKEDSHPQQGAELLSLSDFAHVRKVGLITGTLALPQDGAFLFCIT